MKEISEHFTYEELTYSRIAVENALGNVPGETELKALKVLATNTLEPLRQVLGSKPVGWWCARFRACQR